MYVTGISKNETSVFTLRGRQDGISRRSKKITTTNSQDNTSTTTASSLTLAISTTMITTANVHANSTTSIYSNRENMNVSSGNVSFKLTNNKKKSNIIVPEALVHESWRSNNGSGDTLLLSTEAIEPPIEFVVKPLSKVVLPCELKVNNSKLVPFNRYVSFSFQFLDYLTFAVNFFY